MAQRVVRDPALPVVFGPDDRHVELAVGNMRPVRRRKLGHSQGLVRRVNVQVILLAFDRKLSGRPCRDKVAGVGDPHRVFHAVIAGVRDPLPAGHKLVLGFRAERIAHAAVAARNPDPAADRFQQRRELLPGDRVHCPYRNN